MRNTLWSMTFVPLLLVAGIGASANAVNPLARRSSAARYADVTETRFHVSGDGILFITNEVTHSTEPTPTGLIRRSSVAGTLDGDIIGSFLFVPTATFDFVNGTLVNTGTQFFAGTIAGSETVILHDDTFRFEVDLNTGETHGTIHLSRSNDSPLHGGWFECDLEIVGTGVTADGNLMSDYSGTCLRRGAIS